MLRQSSLLLILLVLPGVLFAQTDFEAEYNRLNALIQERWGEPEGFPKVVEPYLHWLEVKARDRAEVDALLQQLNVLAYQSPDDEELSQWLQDFLDLRGVAQESGDKTSRIGAGQVMRWGYSAGFDGWMPVIFSLKNNGRPLYLKAKETGFETTHVIARAECMLRYSTTDIEFGHTAIWFGREGFLGWYDDEGFQVQPSSFDSDMCMRRRETTRTADGSPLYPVDIAFEQTKQIRDEAEWWQLEGERDDVIDLENDYYEDALCELPPHEEKLGHDWFRGVADAHELEESIEYNEGFYGTLYGVVELQMIDGREPASGARVTVKSGDETWTATADAAGNYEISNVILHDDCSPHEIFATHEGDRVDDTYDGPLGEPDPSARHRKDLLIIPTLVFTWTGTLEVNAADILHCEASLETENGVRSLSQHETQSQHVMLQIYGDKIDETPIGFDIRMGDELDVTGSLNATISNTREYYTRNDLQQRQSVSRSTERGTDSFSVETDNLNMLITRSNPAFSEESLVKLTRQLESGQLDPSKLEEFQAQMEAMLEPKDEDTYDIEVIVQFIGVWNSTIMYTEFNQETRRGETKPPTTESHTREMPLGFLPSIVLNGQYSRGEDGKATIVATVDTTTTTHFSTDFDCPDYRNTVSGTLRLERKKSKN